MNELEVVVIVLAIVLYWQLAYLAKKISAKLDETNAKLENIRSELRSARERRI